MRCRRGDVVLVLFPDSNLRTTKRRPALVVQADDLKTGLPQTVIAMITSNVARAGHKSRVLIKLSTPEGQRTGLRSDSVVLTDNITTVLDREIDRDIGTWSVMGEVDAALRHTFAL